MTAPAVTIIALNITAAATDHKAKKRGLEAVLIMDFSQYENYGFERFSAFNLSTGYQERSYQVHWHSYGEIVLVGPGKTNDFMVNQNTYHLVEGDFLLV